jgi:hypothetical protein
LTLSISNDEVRKSFDLHQSKKFERSVWFLIAGIAVLLLRHILYIWHNRYLMMSDFLGLTILFVYIIIRKKLKNTERLYELVVFLSFALVVITCTLCNLNVLPKKLSPYYTTGLFDYNPFFLTYLAASIPTIRSYLIYLVPL